MKKIYFFIVISVLLILNYNSSSNGYRESIFSQFITYIIGMETFSDIIQAETLWESINLKFNFPVKSKIDPNRPAFYCKYGSNGLFRTLPIIISIYGVFANNDQEKLIQFVKKYKQNHKMYPIIIRFLEEENIKFFVNKAGRVHGGRCGKEKLIRMEIIE